MSQRIQAALVGTDFLALPLTGRCVYRAMGGGVNVQLRGVKPHLFSFALTRCLSTLPIPGVATMSGACSAPRQIYIDAGVNWCNTLELYRRIPEAKAFLRSRGSSLALRLHLGLGAICRPMCANAQRRITASTATDTAGWKLQRELAKYAPLHNCSMEQLGLRPRSSTTARCTVVRSWCRAC